MRTNKSKPVKASQVEMVQLVIPSDTNPLGNLLGGRLMQWIDIAGAIAAARHTNRICVTASVDALHFLHPIKLGEVVILQASVNRTFRTSLEVGVKVIKENLITGERKHTNSAYLTYVAINKKGKPIPIIPVKPESEEEIQRFKEAAERRETRLSYLKKERIKL